MVGGRKLKDVGSTKNAPTFAAMAVLTGVLCWPATAQTGARQAHASDNASAGAWTRCKPMPQGAVFAGTVLGANGHVYVISGSTQYGVKRTNAIRVYDPKHDSWTEAAPIPTARTEPGAAAGADGKIYVVGGGDPAGKKNLLEAYDPRSDTWKRLSPMPTPRESLCAVAAKDAEGRALIYAIGGRDRSRPGNGLSAVEAYDAATDTWTERAPMPMHRHAQVATLGPDSRIYVLGGTNDKVASTDAVEIYDPVRNSWSRGEPAPYRQECAYATFTPGPDGEVLIFAGWDERKDPLRAAAAFNPRTRKWRTLPLVPSARAAGGAVTLEGADGSLSVYLFGGTNEGGGDASQSRNPVEKDVYRYLIRPAPSRRVHSDR